MLTREILEARLTELRETEQEAFARWQALGGAVQATEWVLERFLEEPGEESPPAISIVEEE